MKKTALHILPAGLALLFFSAPASAQLHENVAVEGIYEPVVIETEKIGVYPQAIKFELPSINLDIEDQGIVTDFKPSLLAMGITGWRTQSTDKPQKGYLDLNLGSWLNSNISAGYRAIDNDINTLNLALQFNSTSLSKTSVLPEDLKALSNRYLYDGKFSLGWNHRVNENRLLRTDFMYRLGHFDYFGCTATAGTPLADRKAPAQTLNELQFGMNYLVSPNRAGGWHLGADIRYFGYNSLYPVDFWNAPHISGGRETEIDIHAGYNMPLKGGSRLELNAEGNLLLYGSGKNLPDGLRKNSSYGIISLMPAYRYSNNTFNLKLGAVVDLAINADGSSANKHYPFFHIAPDVKADLRAGLFGMHAGITGGTGLMTLAYREKLDYYQMPYLSTTCPTYTPFNGEISFSIGPASGFTAEAGVGYDVTQHTPIGGWYQMMLGGYSRAASGLASIQGTPVFDYSTRGINLRGVRIKAGLHYILNPIFEASAVMNYSPQNGEKGIFNGYDRSRWTIDVQASCSPVSKLRIDLAYHYRGVRTIYTYMLPDLPGGEETLQGVRLPDITDLNAAITYSFTDNFNVYLRASNLLNRRIELLPAVQTQGIVFSGGFDVRF